MKRQRTQNREISRGGRASRAAAASGGSGALSGHVPVLLEEVVAALSPHNGGIYIDGTFGSGGYSAALLAAARCRVIGIDRDPAALQRGTTLAAEQAGRLTLIEGRFGDMERLIAGQAPGPVAGIALDLGVSSQQLDEPGRGFSFRFDGPLDMRMDAAGETAAELVERLSEEEIGHLIRSLGEERFARRIAHAIAAARRQAPIRRTGQLAEIVRAAVPSRQPGLDAATRTFQALRIAVNDELGELDRGLVGAERLLMPGGRLAVVAFHSLEDARVKNFLRARSGGASVSRHAPSTHGGPAPTFRLLGRRAIRPSADEIARNPRASSARLRAAERTAAPPWPASIGPREPARRSTGAIAR